MVPFARRVRTIRMCSLDARGEGPLQATLVREQVEEQSAHESQIAVAQKVTTFYIGKWRRGSEI
jgi:hypothetical protein